MRLGHVHLRVADLDRAARFYTEAIGMTVTAWGPDRGLPMAILGFDGDPTSHPLALSTFMSAGGSPPPCGHTGLHHVALQVDGPDALAHAARRVIAAGHVIDACADHAATVSVYLTDPEGNGVELYYARTVERWFDDAGRPLMVNEPLDLDAILTARV